ncbi:MAG: hypothetical protein ABJA10_11205, partial [Aestuariivirga sp.]
QRHSQKNSNGEPRVMCAAIALRVAKLERAGVDISKPIRVVWIDPGDDQADDLAKLEEQQEQFTIRLITWLAATAR